MNIEPTVGRMVYYKSYGTPGGEYPSINRAACVTDVKNVTYGENEIGSEPAGFHCRLCVMNPEGLFFTGWLSQGQAPGQWDWMPFQKDQQARILGSGVQTGGASNTQAPSKLD